MMPPELEEELEEELEDELEDELEEELEELEDAPASQRVVPHMQTLVLLRLSLQSVADGP
jgi:hypothetical protein